MDKFHPALPHGDVQEVFPDVFFVTGAMQGHFGGDSLWQFSRAMTVVREDDRLTICNAIRLGDEGLAQLEALGKVTNVVRVGALHGRDDAFYVDRYGATFWAPPGVPHEFDLVPDEELVPGAKTPFAGCEVFAFKETKLPETVLLVDRAGGIAIGCDALMNYIEPDEFFFPETAEIMKGYGFFKEANCGPVWQQHADPKPGDFARLKERTFKPALCGHGAPLKDRAHEAFSGFWAERFGV